MNRLLTVSEARSARLLEDVCRLLPSEASSLLALRVELSCCAVLGLQMAPFAVLALSFLCFFFFVMMSNTWENLFQGENDWFGSQFQSIRSTVTVPCFWAMWLSITALKVRGGGNCSPHNNQETDTGTGDRKTCLSNTTPESYFPLPHFHTSIQLSI